MSQVTEVQITTQIDEWRDKYPEMFSRPEGRDGEICIDEQVVDLAVINEDFYRRAGIRSLRLTKRMKSTKLASDMVADLEYWSFFVDAREYARVVLENQ